MSEEKKITPAESGKEFDRRAFFVKLGLGSLSIAAAGTAAFCLPVSLAECFVRALSHRQRRQAGKLCSWIR